MNCCDTPSEKSLDLALLLDDSSLVRTILGEHPQEILDYGLARKFFIDAARYGRFRCLYFAMQNPYIIGHVLNDGNNYNCAHDAMFLAARSRTPESIALIWNNDALRESLLKLQKDEGANYGAGDNISEILFGIEAGETIADARYMGDMRYMPPAKSLYGNVFRQAGFLIGSGEFDKVLKLVSEPDLELPLSFGARLKRSTLHIHSAPTP